MTAGLRAATRRDRPASLLDVAGHLVRDPLLELHWIAYGLLERTIARGARAHLAAGAGRGPVGRELDLRGHPGARRGPRESSPSRTAGRSWSSSSTRRRAGSDASPAPPIADDPARRTGPPAAPPRLSVAASAIVDDLIGDPEPDVQKALSWALRTLASVDLAATAAFLRAETRTARATDDGYRAWVIRDTLREAAGAARGGAAGRPRAASAGAPAPPRRPEPRRRPPTSSRTALAVPPAERPVIDRT